MLREVAFPVALCWNISPVSWTETFTMYSVMMPFCAGAGGGFQLTRRVLESRADSEILTGAAEGTRKTKVKV